MTSERQPRLSPQQNCLSHAQSDSFFPIPLFLYGLTIPAPTPNSLSHVQLVLSPPNPPHLYQDSGSHRSYSTSRCPSCFESPLPQEYRPTTLSLSWERMKGDIHTAGPVSSTTYLRYWPTTHDFSEVTETQLYMWDPRTWGRPELPVVLSARISRMTTVVKCSFVMDMLKSLEGCVACDWVGITAAEQGPASVSFGNGPG